jgi:hypothetical protein
VTVQSFDDDRACVPTPRMQPVRQQAHRVAADQAQKASDPDNDPSCFNQPANLAGVHAVSNQLQNSFSIPGSLAAEDAKPRTKIFQRRSICAPSAELLDSNSEAV